MAGPGGNVEVTAPYTAGSSNNITVKNLNITATSITSAASPSELFAKKENFVSEAFISRGADGTSNLVFSFDQRRMLQKFARYGGMLTTRNDDVFKEVRQNSRILSLKVLRTRIQDNFLLNREAEELIVFNSET